LERIRKHVFQLHEVNSAEQPVLRKKLRRKEMVEFLGKGRALDRDALPHPGLAGLVTGIFPDSFESFTQISL